MDSMEHSGGQKRDVTMIRPRVGVVQEECVSMNVRTKMPTSDECISGGRVCDAKPKSSMEKSNPENVPTNKECVDREYVCNANPKSSKVKTKPSMEKSVCCTVSLQKDDECECQAKSNPKSRIVVSKPKFKIHTTSRVKFVLEREEGSLLQEKKEKVNTNSDSSSKLTFSSLIQSFESKITKNNPNFMLSNSN